MRLVLGGLMASVVLCAMPVQAQVSDAQVLALVEALRLAAPTTPPDEDGLYSPWKIKPANILRWSRLCIGEELTPEEFTANPGRARNILVCVMQDVLTTEYPASGNDEFVAVRRAAAWWVSGDSTLYDSGDIGYYSEKVLGLYQQLRSHPTDFLGPRRSR